MSTMNKLNLMAKSIIIFHGSNLVVSNPKILTEGYTKDFGYGFYCSCIEKQAERWAGRKGKGNGIVNRYSFTMNNSLKYLKFDKENDEWLDFVVSCRMGNSHNYDVVEGPMADDQIYNYISDFISGDLTREQFWIMIRFKYPTQQFCFCSDKALKYLTFLDSREV